MKLFRKTKRSVVTNTNRVVWHGCLKDLPVMTSTSRDVTNTHLPNIWVFFILSGAYLSLNAASYDGEILHAHACRPCAKMCWVLYVQSIGVVVTKIMTFLRACTPTILLPWPQVGRCDRSSRPIPAGWLAGMLQQRAGLLQWPGRRVAIWLAPACLM